MWLWDVEAPTFSRQLAPRWRWQTKEERIILDLVSYTSLTVWRAHIFSCRLASRQNLCTEQVPYQCPLRLMQRLLLAVTLQEVISSWTWKSELSLKMYLLLIEMKLFTGYSLRRRAFLSSDRLIMTYSDRTYFVRKKLDKCFQLSGRKQVL
jgi:hypothetical protein